MTARTADQVFDDLQAVLDRHASLHAKKRDARTPLRTLPIVRRALARVEHEWGLLDRELTAMLEAPR